MQNVTEIACGRITQFCTLEEYEDNLIGDVLQPCDYQYNVNYYISDPVLYFEVNNNKIISIDDTSIFLVFRNSENIYFTRWNLDYGGSSNTSNRDLYTSLFNEKENFIMLSSEGNLWVITDNDEILVSKGLGSPEKLEESIKKQVRERILPRYQYSFYLHLLELES